MNDFCAICIEDFTEAELELCNSFKVPSGKTDGIIGLDGHTEEEKSLYANINKCKDKFFNKVSNELSSKSELKDGLETELAGKGL